MQINTEWRIAEDIYSRTTTSRAQATTIWQIGELINCTSFYTVFWSSFKSFLVVQKSNSSLVRGLDAIIVVVDLRVEPLDSHVLRVDLVVHVECHVLQVGDARWDLKEQIKKDLAKLLVLWSKNSRPAEAQFNSRAGNEHTVIWLYLCCLLQSISFYINMRALMKL